MKISNVLLRWYRSFNINYVGYVDRRDGAVARPWNLYGREATDEVLFPFIEIPIEGDATTIVGGNESGKSHLLNAISKVLTGKGIEKSDSFSRTDLCHFAGVGNKNADAWPNVGLEIQLETKEEFQNILTAIGATISPAHMVKDARIVLILLNDQSAILYIGLNDSPTPLDSKKLAALRKVLPTVKFLNSDVAMADQVPLVNLLAAYDPKKYGSEKLYDASAAQMAADVLKTLSLNPGQVIPDAEFQKISEAKTRIDKARLDVSSAGKLEALLFGDILGIKIEALEFLKTLAASERSSAEGLIGTWNGELEEKLNLSRYWQQDDQFSLLLNYKDGVLYFEIKDKTKSIYTFKERSSGLRYFLSYYIQAKALELSQGYRNSVILMDEPDSFLSTLGQKNLLTVFESLINPDSATGTCQLIYTTHSPFLVNRNFPRRIRLLRKGDAEEGTQYIDQAMVRRYEPIRSALGIDCAQTLFMGATNLVLEGPTDQFIFAELIRLFSTQETIGELIDLNSLTIVSADSATGVEKLLEASQWGDEPIPATVVLLDSDSEGDIVFEKITGKARNKKRMIEDEFVARIKDCFGVKHGVAVTIEDIIPIPLFSGAILAYVAHWYPNLAKETEPKIRQGIEKADFNANGLVSGGQNLFREIKLENSGYDKMGVLQELVKIVAHLLRDKPGDQDLELLRTNTLSLCAYLKKKIENSRQVAKRRSGKQSVQRIIHDFLVSHKHSVVTYDLQMHFERLQSEADALGQDGEKLKVMLVTWINEIQSQRNAGQKRLTPEQWKKWVSRLAVTHHNPLDPSAAMEANLPKEQLAESKVIATSVTI